MHLLDLIKSQEHDNIEVHWCDKVQNDESDEWAI